MIKLSLRLPASATEAIAKTLYHQISSPHSVRKIETAYQLYANEWDAKSAAILLPESIHHPRYAYLLSVRTAISAEQEKLGNILSRFNALGLPCSTDAIVAQFQTDTHPVGFLGYAQSLIGQLRQAGKLSITEKYISSLRSFQRYLGKDELQFSSINSTLMLGYESYLHTSGKCRNTSSFYMRNLRAIYNRAVDDGLTIPSQPFKHVYTGIDKTVKRAISLETIQRMVKLDLHAQPLLEYARDLFLFSFFTRGMSFIDMANLRKRNLQNGILRYRRQKTSQQLCIKWEQPMQAIINKYDSSGSSFLLPIIRDEHKDFRRQYRYTYGKVNLALKEIGRQLQIAIPLTTYVARHSWASIAKSQQIPLATISEALGHDSENTTRIYLSSLDSSVVDNANSLIIGATLG